MPTPPSYDWTKTDGLEGLRSKGLNPSNPGLPPRVTDIGIGAPYQTISSPISNHPLMKMNGVSDSVNFRTGNNALGDMLDKTKEHMLGGAIRNRK